MQIAEARHAGVDVLAPSGRIDTTTVSALEGRLAPLVALDRPHIVIDFSEVDYISSAGLRVLLMAARGVQDGDGRLALCGLNDAVRQVFYLAGFLPLFLIVGSRADAVDRIAP